MATPPNASTFLAALKSEGLKVVEVPGWETWNRNTRGPWGPVHGVMIHHTVTKGTQESVRIVKDGYRSLPGPLCHGMIAKDGSVHLVGYGRTNHAGLGDPDVLAAVIAERPFPLDGAATVDGNRHFYGFECENMGDGIDPWPPAQIEAVVRTIAALCRFHKWSYRSALRHLDWQPGKIDPRGPGLNWDAVISQVNDRLAVKPPKPSLPKVSLSRIIAAAKSNPSSGGKPVTYDGVKTVETALVDAGLLSKPYSDGHYGTVTLKAYRLWQERCGYRGKDADGIPGSDSLGKLAAAYAFSVTP